MGRTLVIHTGGIGDFLLCCPTLGPLAESGPVDLLGRTDRLELAVCGGLANAAFALESVHLESIFHKPDDTLREFLQNYTRVVTWMRDDDGAIQRGLKRVGVRDIHLHPGLPPEAWSRHATEYYLDRLGLPDQPPLRLTIEPSGDSRDVLIHPGSGGQTKNWPLARFVELARALTDAGRKITWCLGPAEIERGLVERVGDGEVLATESLVRLAGVLASARFYIGNDSGITHLAAAVGCPTLALFGPTNPSVWAPRGERVRVVSFDDGTTASDIAAAVG